MGHSKGYWLQTGNWIGQGDYLVSPSELCYAIMQENGNFCVYRGYGPENSQGLIWEANPGPQDGNIFFATMQEDGNFVIYRGWNPGSNEGLVWATNTDEPDGNHLFYLILSDDGKFEIHRGRSPAEDAGVYHTINVGDPYTWVGNVQDIHYDTANATVTDYPAPLNTYELECSNQSGTFLVQTKVPARLGEKCEWSDLLGKRGNEPDSYYSAIPDLLPNGGGFCFKTVVLYVWNGSGKEPFTILDFSANVTVSTPVQIARAYVTRAAITMPCRITCMVRTQSGIELQTRLLGTYTGTTFHNPRFNLYGANNVLISTVPGIADFKYTEAGNVGPR